VEQTVDPARLARRGPHQRGDADWGAAEFGDVPQITLIAASIISIVCEIMWRAAGSEMLTPDEQRGRPPGIFSSERIWTIMLVVAVF
jgi:hypothetical protein